MYLFVKFMPVYMYIPVKYSKGVGARGTWFLGLKLSTAGRGGGG